MKNEPCSIKNCPATVTVARGWCSKHYATWKRHGTPTGGREYSKGKPIEPIIRFLEKIIIEGDCWIWTAARRGAYGQFWPGGDRGTKLVKAHRWSFEYYTKSTIPNDKEVCHKCDQPLCVNPEHLWLGTHLDNLADSASKGRQLGNSRSKNGRAKLTEEDIVTIRSRATGRFGEISEFAREYDVGSGTMSKILKNQTWRD